MINREKAEKTACKLYIPPYMYVVPVAVAIICGLFTTVITYDALVEAETTTAEIEQTETQQDYYYKSLGEYELTAYCPCPTCCGGYADGITSTGTEATAGRTIAVDPSKIPYGTVIYINGIEYVAEDCGGAIKGKKLDIFFDTHDEAVAFGRQTAEIFIKKEC